MESFGTDAIHASSGRVASREQPRGIVAGALYTVAPREPGAAAERADEPTAPRAAAAANAHAEALTADETKADIQDERYSDALPGQRPRPDRDRRSRGPAWIRTRDRRIMSPLL